MAIKTKFFLTIFFLSVTLLLKAAEISFVVYHAAGKVNKAGSKTNLKKGDKILSTEVLVLSDKSSLVLICSNFKAIQLAKKGSYSAKSLLQQCNNSAASYTGNYFKYVWNEFTHKHGKPESNPGDYMTNTGAVSRGGFDAKFSLALDTLYFNKGFLPVNWQSLWDTSIAAIYDMPLDGAALQKIVLEKDQPLQMQKLTAGLQPGDYYWLIMDKEGNGGERKYIKVMDEASYQQEIDKLSSMIIATSPAETAFAKAFIFQENHFLAEALYHYQLALKFDPKNNIFKKAVSQFYETNF